MKKVIIIAHSFHNKEIIGAIRIQGLVKFLSDYGWTPTIITSKSINDTNEFRSDYPFEVITIPYVDELERWKKLFGFSPIKTVREQLSKKTHKNKTLLDIVMEFWIEIIAYPDSEKNWLKPALPQLRALLKKTHYDAVISTSSPVTSHIIVCNIKKEYSIPWVADFRDLWTQNHYYHYSKIRKFFEQRLEYNTLSTANTLTTVSQPLANRLTTLHKYSRVVSIPNGFDPDQINPGVPLTKKFCIAYTGFLYKDHRDPEPLFRILRVLIDEKTIDPELIEVNFFGYDEGWLIADVKKYQLQDVVKINGRVSREESILKQRESQLLLLLTWNDPDEKGVYTGKLFDYLAARRPILSMGYSDGGVVKNLLNQTKAGVHVSNDDELKAELIKAYHQFKENGTVLYRGIDVEIMKYSHREMARKFAKVLDEVCESQS